MPIEVGYSVGTTGVDRKTGSPTMTISGGVMTFNIAQTGNIGKGDIVEANSLFYMLTGKTSTSIWSVRNKDGTAASNVGSPTTVDGIEREFSSSEDAAHGATAMAGDASHLNTYDLAANDYNLSIVCYDDASDDSLVEVNTVWTTDATRRIKIFAPIDTVNDVNNSQRNDRIQNGGGYVVQSTVGTGRSNFELMASFVTIEGIKIIRTSTNDKFRRAIDQASGGGNDNSVFKCFVICESGNDDSTLVNHNSDNTSGLRFSLKGNFVLSESAVCKSAFSSDVNFNDTASDQSHLYNNIFYGKFAETAVKLRSQNDNDAGRQDYKNNYMFNSTANPDIIFQNNYNNAVVNYDNNATDTTEGGTNNDNIRILVVNMNFVDETANQLDLHISAGSTAIDAGVGPATDSEVPTEDGDEDPISGTDCDIGGDEFVGAPSSGGASNLLNYISRVKGKTTLIKKQNH